MKRAFRTELNKAVWSVYALLAFIVLLGGAGAWAVQDSTSSATDRPTVVQHGNIVTFYPYVRSYIRMRQKERSHLVILCQKKINVGYVSFLGKAGGDKTIIAVLSKEPFKKIDWRRYQDWAYVFDRNRDGKIDYFSYMMGPWQVLPEGSKAPVSSGNSASLEAMLQNIHVVFWDVADDNFDGRADGVAFRMRDVKTNWADSWLLVRDLNFDGQFNNCVWYEAKFASKSRDCELKNGQYTVPGKTLLGLAGISVSDPFPTQVLSAFNDGVGMCRFGADSFYGLADVENPSP